DWYGGNLFQRTESRIAKAGEHDRVRTTAMLRVSLERSVSRDRISCPASHIPPAKASGHTFHFHVWRDELQRLGNDEIRDRHGRVGIDQQKLHDDLFRLSERSRRPPLDPSAHPAQSRGSSARTFPRAIGERERARCCP